MFHYLAWLHGWAGLIGVLVVGLFQLWMFIDAVRKGEWMWAVFIWLFPMLNAVLYYFCPPVGVFSGAGIRAAGGGEAAKDPGIAGANSSPGQRGASFSTG